jgi:hypothetical protein
LHSAFNQAFDHAYQLHSNDSYNCGPWVIEIARYFITTGALPSPGEIDIEKSRQEHQVDLRIIQSANIPQSKIEDGSSISNEEMPPLEEDIDRPDVPQTESSTFNDETSLLEEGKNDSIAGEASDAPSIEKEENDIRSQLSTEDHKEEKPSHGTPATPILFSM